MDASLNSLNFLDTDGRPDACMSRLDGSLGSDFSDLESAESSLNLLKYISEMKTLK